MTPLVLLSKLWFLILFMINARFVFMLIGFLVGGVATLESSLVRGVMAEAQQTYHDVSHMIMQEGSQAVPQLNQETVQQSYQSTRDQFDFRQ